MQAVELLRSQEDGVQLAVHRGVLHRGRLPPPRAPPAPRSGSRAKWAVIWSRKARRADEEHPPIAVTEDVDPRGNRQGLARLVRQPGRAVVDGQRPPGQEPRAGGRGRRRRRMGTGWGAGGGGGLKPAGRVGGGRGLKAGGGARGASLEALPAAPVAVSCSWRTPAWPAGQAPRRPRPRLRHPPLAPRLAPR